MFDISISSSELLQFHELIMLNKGHRIKKWKRILFIWTIDQPVHADLIFCYPLPI